MPTLKDFTTMYLSELKDVTLFDNNIYLLCEDDQHCYPTTPKFDEYFWNDLAMEMRGLSLVYDSFEEFLDDFKPWWKMRVHEYARIFYTAIAKYNTLHNYDRTETITEKSETKGNERTSAEDRRKGENNAVQNSDVKDTVNSAGTVKDVVLNTDTATEKVNGFNSAEEELSTKGKTERTLDSVTTSNSDNTTSGHSNTNAHATNRHSENSTMQGEKNSNGETLTTREVRMYGNIGVTTSQQMLTAERQLMADHVVQYVAKDFKQAFCLLVY